MPGHLPQRPLKSPIAKLPFTWEKDLLAWRVPFTLGRLLHHMGRPPPRMQEIRLPIRVYLTMRTCLLHMHVLHLGLYLRLLHLCLRMPCLHLHLRLRLLRLCLHLRHLRLLRLRLRQRQRAWILPRLRKLP